MTSYSTLILRAALLVTLTALATASTGFAWHPQTHVVVGQNDVAVDRIAIQNAIDAAAPRDTVELQGTFQLDGVSILLRTTRLTLAGQVVDNDGDGLANEDWSDGADNDGDGLIDEDDRDAILLGVDDGAGGPAGDSFPDRFNDGIEILGLEDDLRQITIRDILFRRLNRAIYAFPDYDDAGTTLLCDASTPTEGSVHRLDIKDNSFENVIRGVEIVGDVRHSRIRDNFFEAVLVQGVILFGQELACAEADGSLIELLPLRGLRRMRVTGNQFQNNRVGVISLVTTRTRIHDNVFQAPFFGIVSLEDKKLVASQNEIDFALAGYFASTEPLVDGPASGNLFFGNTVTDSVYGAIVDCDTTGNTLISNDFTGSVVVDVLLDGTQPGGECAFFGLGDSFENTVIAFGFETTALDFGVDNHLFGTTPPMASLSNKSSVMANVRKIWGATSIAP